MQNFVVLLVGICGALIGVGVLSRFFGQPQSGGESEPRVLEAKPPTTPAIVLPAVSDVWRKEWRRVGGGAMTVAFIAGVGWLSATQTFVTLHNGKLEHPAWWQWPFWVCIVGALGGLYVVLTTYHDRLPMWGRDRTVDHSTMYALALEGLFFTYSRDPLRPAQVDVALRLHFTNGVNRVIEMEMIETRLVINNQSPPITQVGPEATTIMRILPLHTRGFFLPVVVGLPDGHPIVGTLRYAVRYGPPSGFPLYERNHAIRFWGLGPADPVNVPNHDWMDLAPETDEIIAPSPVGTSAVARPIGP